MATLQSTTINDTGYLILPKGTTAQRPSSPTTGMIRYNTEYQYTEYYNGSAWNPINNAIATFNSAPTGSSLAVNNAGFRTHSFLYREIYNSLDSVSVTDDASDANYKVMKTFTVSYTGTIDVRFAAYIQSGSFYWAWRIRRNSSSTLSFGGFGSGPFYGNDSASVHDYRRLISTGLSVVAGDIITVEMVSSSGGESPVSGNGQILYLKDLQVFLKEHIFRPTMSGLVEVLVVGGGGSGGAMGGGGGGGVVYRSSYPVIAGTAYSVTVGAGGAASFASIGFAGVSSTFDSLTATGGGYGGGATAGSPPSVGGSGGGGQGLDFAGTGAAGTSGQGFSGGNGFTVSGGTNGGGGGGGGAGGPGGNAPAFYIGGNGGRGLTSNITGFPVTYAAGGGGGAYYYNNWGSGGFGNGPGGNGGAHGVVGTDGEENTGSGGGAAGYIDNLGYNTSSGAGAHGIIIVRYPYQGPPSVAHSFSQVGSHYWTCPSGVSQIELLVVGGGGGGGEGHGGGGGAGGLVYSSAYPVSAGTTYAITVGAGGKFQNSGTNTAGNAGSNSVFNDIIGYGGGAGGVYGSTGGTGGSGGGSGGATGSNSTAYTGQGNIGGNGLSIVNGGGGGGGGAAGPGGTAYGAYVGAGGGDAGQNAGSRGGSGGAGLPFAISGQVKYYAGGGGGGGEGHSRRGVGGQGGGGDGGYFSLNGMPQGGEHGTGGGGGGGSAGGSGAIGGGRAGGPGGSGIVIIRYNLS